MHKKVNDMLQSTLIEFNDWLQRKPEGHERLNVSGTSKSKVVEVKTSSMSLSVTALATCSQFVDYSQACAKDQPGK